ncbi:MAG: flagellar export chaperone FlgN [Gemmatimonadota bacterium]
MPNAMPRTAGAPSGNQARLAPMVQQLVDAIRCEARLVQELIALQRQQREAIAADDLRAMEDTTFGTQRVLCTLAEAHRLRCALNDHLGVVEHGALPDMFGALEPAAAAVLRTERDRLMETTRVLVREVRANRALLSVSLAKDRETVGSEPER